MTTTRRTRIEEMPYSHGPVSAFAVKPVNLRPFDTDAPPIDVKVETIEPVDLAYPVLDGVYFTCRVTAYTDRDGDPVVVFMGSPEVRARAHARRGETEAQLLNAMDDLAGARRAARWEHQKRMEREREEENRTRGTRLCGRVLSALDADIGW